MNNTQLNLYLFKPNSIDDNFGKSVTDKTKLIYAEFKKFTWRIINQVTIPNIFK